jgi:NADH-quinone oxidoreductase subunit L
VDAHHTEHAVVAVTVVGYLRWIPLLPFAAMLFHALFGRVAGRKAVGVVACAAVGASFLLAVRAFLQLGSGGGVLSDVVYRWIDAGGLTADVAMAIDPLSAVMCLVITGVGFLIHVYSTGYMAHDPDYARYFAYLNLFTASMLVLVLGDSLPLMFVGWEGVGLCSYLLIGFWYTDPAKADAGKKAFVVNRVGDAGFIIGMAVLFWGMAAAGPASLRFADINAAAATLPTGVTLAAALLLFVGATGKSAQLPLFVWLPDAMAGPTPVSALIHAATMVTAGVYMVARLSGLYTAAPEALSVVAVVGAVTAFGAASVGLVQNDIKKVLAYSTVSQLGYMFLALGVGAFGAAIFHVMTHAFFKALLFLGAGSVIHGLHEEQDIRRMGALRSRMPVTWATFLVGTIAIAGIPGLAGFFSKDEILAATYDKGAIGLWVMGVAAATMTAFYMTRLLVLTFHGEFRGDHHKWEHAHESPVSMTSALCVLALLSIVGGYVGVPAVLGGGNHFGHYLAPVVGHHELHLSHSTELVLMAISIGAAVLGMGTAWFIYGRSPRADEAFAARAAGVHGLLSNAYYVDRTYDRTIVAGTVRSGEALWKRVDVAIIDGAANALAATVRAFGGSWRAWAGGNVQGYALSFFVGVVVVLILMLAGAGG